jgi:hypothetical protein
MVMLLGTIDRQLIELLVRNGGGPLQDPFPDWPEWRGGLGGARRRRRLLLPQLAEQQAGGLRHGVVEGREPAAIHGRLD